VRALTIAELERESGVPRQTIYYYVRIGLLPVAQKSSPSRALYTDDHIALLHDIEALRVEGLRPAAIRARIAGRIEAAGASEVDLVARREEETRDAILSAATRGFAVKGFRGTRMADLIAELGITPQLLYQHFPTKRDLFVACYKIAVQYINVFLRDRFAEARDAPERMLWYMYADEGIKAFAPGMFALALEAAQHDEQARRDLREAYETIFRDHIEELGGLRTSPGVPPLPDELISHGIMGAFEQMLARASLDDRYSWRDVVRTTLGMYLAVLALYRGELDVGALLAPYEGLLDEVAELPPPVPPELAGTLDKQMK
jgi:AcrR family transcriptional regulator